MLRYAPRCIDTKDTTHLPPWNAASIPIPEALSTINPRIKCLFCGILWPIDHYLAPYVPDYRRLVLDACHSANLLSIKSKYRTCFVRGVVTENMNWTALDRKLHFSAAPLPSCIAQNIPTSDGGCRQPPTQKPHCPDCVDHQDFSKRKYQASTKYHTVICPCIIRINICYLANNRPR